MLTRISDEDWVVHFRCSGGYRSRRGDKNRDDRRRLRQVGVFELLLETVASLSRTAHLMQMFDTTVVRAHVSPLGQTGAAGPGPRPLMRPLLHQDPHKCDFDGLSIAFHLTDGAAGDSPLFKLLLDLGPDVTPRATLADKGCDAKAKRAPARACGIAPAIPFQSNAKNRLAFFPKALYRGRSASSCASESSSASSASPCAARRQNAASPPSSPSP